MPKAPRREPTEGVRCQTCGNRRTRIELTRREGDHVTRHRRCPYCGQMTVTSERVVVSRPVPAVGGDADGGS